MRRLILIVFLLPIALILLGAIAASLLLDKQKVLAMAAQVIEEESGAILTVEGDINLSVFPNISVQLGDAGITVPGEQEVAVQVRQLGIGLQLRPLLSGDIQIDEILIDGLTMVLQAAPPQDVLDTSQLSDQQLDDYYAERRQGQTQELASRTGAQDSVLAIPLALNVRHLLVTDSIFETVSPESGERSKVVITKLQANDLNLDNRPIPVSAKVLLPDDSEMAPIGIALDGEVGVNVERQQLVLEALVIKIDGVMSETVSLNASGVVDLVTQAADLRVEFDLAETRGTGKVRYATFETPQIAAQLHLNRFDPALIALAGPEVASVPSGQTEQGAESDGDQPLPLAPIREIDTWASLRIDTASFSGHDIQNMTLKLRAVDGIVRINSLTGNVHGGALDIKATFNAQHNVAKLNSQGTLAGMDLALALAAMEFEPMATGTAGLEWRLRSSGATMNELIGGLSGPVDIATEEVTLLNLGIDKMLCEAVALANRETLTTQLPEETPFENLSLKLKLKKGKGQMNPFSADLAHSHLTGTGTFDLDKQDFAATFTARLSPTLAELDPACRVNERYTAIGWPVNCAGDIGADPADWCGVDSQKIIEDMATKEVKRQVEKEAGRYLDKLFKK
ncbi:MAG: AsmA family protein [Halioglobus sp.]